jgi:hypothetical protein
LIFPAKPPGTIQIVAHSRTVYFDLLSCSLSTGKLYAKMLGRQFVEVSERRRASEWVNSRDWVKTRMVRWRSAGHFSIGLKSQTTMLDFLDAEKDAANRIGTRSAISFDGA